ncbi:hypothetical protein J6590_028389 [Homalodisca vitripennis]|nr:hypothetical protein J6590_028389 [Homalodisca vitripennis]
MDLMVCVTSVKPVMEYYTVIVKCSKKSHRQRRGAELAGNTIYYRRVSQTGKVRQHFDNNQVVACVCVRARGHANMRWVGVRICRNCMWVVRFNGRTQHSTRVRSFHVAGYSGPTEEAGRSMTSTTNSKLPLSLRGPSRRYPNSKSELRVPPATSGRSR